MSGRCRACGSGSVVPDIWVFTSVGSTRDTAYVTLKPPKGSDVDFRLHGRLCADCGHLDLFVANAAELAAALGAGAASPK